MFLFRTQYLLVTGGNCDTIPARLKKEEFGYRELLKKGVFDSRLWIVMVNARPYKPTITTTGTRSTQEVTLYVTVDGNIFSYQAEFVAGKQTFGKLALAKKLTDGEMAAYMRSLPEPKSKAPQAEPESSLDKLLAFAQGWLAAVP